jgi:chromate transporter
LSGAARELAGLFLKLGTTAFGGPAAHVAMMEDEVVRRRGWMSRETFLDYLSAANLVPGPNSTELALHVGLARDGARGLVVAGLAFILPAACIVGGIAWAYVRFGALPAAAGVLYGVKPVVIAVVAQALWGFGRTALRTAPLTLLAAAAAAAFALGVHEIAVLVGAGVVATLAAAGARQAPSLVALVAAGSVAPRTGTAGAALLAAGVGVPAAGAAAASTGGLWTLFGVFAKTGALLFGSGYVLVAFLRADLVQRLGWLTERQLLDAVAVGQVTPGPLFTTATFVGYLVGGWPGAVVATVGIFLPAFLYVAVSGPLVRRVRRSRLAGAALDGVNVASLALMGVVGVQLARAALVDSLTVGLAGASALLLLRWRVNSAWLVAGGAAVGVVAGLAGLVR